MKLKLEGAEFKPQMCYSNTHSLQKDGKRKEFIQSCSRLTCMNYQNPPLNKAAFSRDNDKDIVPISAVKRLISVLVNDHAKQNL
ncbi:hypothetical protein BB561_006721 [Smittium simulii]|uniref:Uncharacterized protein n=1 Tax=Smittium simulii TaxID=133385 RepID=A0A2T9Y209_9FUNG|nr:hypothetical protein BB561_006721 [Smittium simulii]